MIKLLRLPMLSLMVGLGPTVSAGNDTLHVKNPRVIGIKSHYGFILPHSESIREISYSKPRGFQVDYARHLNTQWVWDYFGTYPRVGVSFAYFNYDNPEILGNSYTLKTYFEPYITYRFRINPTFRIGLGISYLDNVYNPVNNPHNLFYSSPISFFILTNVGLNYRVNDFFDMTVSANFSHISNGSIKKPNKGINVPSLSMGLEYKLDKVNLEKRIRQLSKHDIHGKLWKINAGFYTSIKEIDTHGNKYHIYGIELTSGLIVNRVSAFNVGIDVSHDRSLSEKNKMDIDGSANFSPTILSGILSHELLMGSFIFDQTIGWYINKPSVNSLPYYQKIGIGYRVNRSLNMGLSLKAHRISADFISLKMGMKL